MKLSSSLVIIIVAFILSLSGFILSVVMPQSDASDAAMVAALFCAAASGITTSVFTKQLVRSRYQNYISFGGLMLLLSFPVKLAGFVFLNNILKVSGGTIAIAAFAYYVYLHWAEFKNSKWIWFLPFILLGCLFKYMHWTGANIVIFSSLATLILMTIIQLVRLRNCTKVQVWLLVWQLVMCGCIAVFYFRYVKLDSFIIGYIFTWLAVIYILLQNENKFQDKNDYN